MTLTAQKNVQILSKHHGNQCIEMTKQLICRALQNSPPYFLHRFSSEKFVSENRNLAIHGGFGRPKTNQEKFEQARELFQSFLALSICNAACIIERSLLTVHHILLDLLLLLPYTLQNFQALVEEGGNNGWIVLSTVLTLK